MYGFSFSSREPFTAPIFRTFSSSIGAETNTLLYNAELLFQLNFLVCAKPATNEQKVFPVPAAPFTITIGIVEGEAVRA